jgi:hypothetical protein
LKSPDVVLQMALLAPLQELALPELVLLKH